MDNKIIPVGADGGMSKEAVDTINHPAHYTKYNVEVIDITRYLPFCLGNVVKYVLRAPYKGGVEDCNKALQYLDWSEGQPIVIQTKDARSLMCALDELVVFFRTMCAPYSMLLESFVVRLRDVLYADSPVKVLRPIIIGLHERMSFQPGIAAHERLLQRD